jgi:YidC/Oxa1 family membrane protein insertase
MDNQKRQLLAVGLVLVLTAIYWTFFMPTAPRQPPVAVSPVAPDAGTRSASTFVPPVTTPIEAVAEDKEPAQEIERLGPQVQYVFSTRGAGLVQAKLLGKKMREQLQLSVSEGLRLLVGGKIPPPPQMDMARPVRDQPLPLTISVEGSQPLSPTASYSPAPGGASDPQLTFTTRRGGWEVVKKFEFIDDGLEGTCTISLKNISSQAVNGQLVINYSRSVDPGSEEKPSMFGGVGNLSSAACSVGEDLHKLEPDSKPTLEFQGPLNFVGIDQQYFLAALFPLRGPQNGRCVLSVSASSRSVSAYFPLQVGPGESFTQTFGFFMGPKDFDRLSTVSARLTAAIGLANTYSPQLEKTVAFGIWAFICKILLWILKFAHNMFGNWGVAIIVLTIVVKLVLLPLTHKSMVSGEAMKKLQPKVEEIRKKHAADKERQNQEMMKLYQEAKVNPLGGCLPLLLQMPVWFALYTTLRNTYEIYGEPFIPPIWMDLTYKDPTYLLPAALGVTMIITQRLQPQVMDAAQARIMTYIMPVFFTAIMLNYPAGLTLYIFTNNLLSIGQQYGLRKYLEKKGSSNSPEKKK